MAGNEIKWEALDGYHFRMKVPGGWVFKVIEDVYEDRSANGQGMCAGWQFRIAICFIPDPNYIWLKEEEKVDARPSFSKGAATGSEGSGG